MYWTPRPQVPGFDRAYIDQEVAAHRAVKDLLERSEAEADNADLKAAIGQARPVVDRHLKEAEELQQKLSRRRNRSEGPTLRESIPG